MPSNRRHYPILFCLLTAPCLAQRYSPAPVIQLSPEETAQARRLAADLRDSQKRLRDPELQGARFTSDLHHAYGIMAPTGDGVYLVDMIPLSTEEAAKLAAIEREISPRVTPSAAPTTTGSSSNSNSSPATLP